MSKNIETPVTAESVITQAVEEKLVTPTVPAQATEEKKSVDEFDTMAGGDVNSEPAKFHAVVGVGDEIHHFDSVAGLLKHITVTAFKNRKVQAAAAVTVGGMAAFYAFTKKKATEVIELDAEDDQELLDELNEAETNGAVL